MDQDRLDNTNRVVWIGISDRDAINAFKEISVHFDLTFTALFKKMVASFLVHEEDAWNSLKDKNPELLEKIIRGDSDE